MKTFAVFVLVLTVLTSCHADSASDPVIGTNNQSNCIPFSCDAILGLGFSPYQQIYASSAFTGVTPFNQINFFLSVPGALDFGTYTIDFSYTPQAVNALSSASPSANIGADETLFGSFTLSGGAAPSTLTFTGNTFTYDPAMGNPAHDHKHFWRVGRCGDRGVLRR